MERALTRTCVWRIPFIAVSLNVVPQLNPICNKKIQAHYNGKCEPHKPAHQRSANGMMQRSP